MSIFAKQTDYSFLFALSRHRAAPLDAHDFERCRCEDKHAIRAAVDEARVLVMDAYKRLDKASFARLDALVDALACARKPSSRAACVWSGVSTMIIAAAIGSLAMRFVRGFRRRHGGKLPCEARVVARFRLSVEEINACAMACRLTVEQVDGESALTEWIAKFTSGQLDVEFDVLLDKARS